MNITSVAFFCDLMLNVSVVDADVQTHRIFGTPTYGPQNYLF